MDGPHVCIQMLLRPESLAAGGFALAISLGLKGANKWSVACR